MKPQRIYLWLMMALMMLVTACHDDPKSEPHISGRTVVVFMPWTFDLQPFFDQNIKDIEEVIASGALADERVMVCVAPTTLKAILFELRGEQGKCVRDTIEVFDNMNFLKASNITKLLATVEKTAPAHHYAMIMAGHGMAWLPAGTSPIQKQPRHLKGNRPLTRWIGGSTSGSQIEISTLEEGIQQAGMHMDYILFDDCYMSSVEVAYEMREVTDYIIGCPTEIMAYGFPYKQCFRYLLGSPDYKRLCESFLDFYSHYLDPYGTVAVTDCRELEALADVARRITSAFPTTQQYNDSIQQMDGYTPPLFYDLGDTYAHLCKDKALLTAFNTQLERTVPYKACTASYYSYYGGYYTINHYSGLTTSQTSSSPHVTGWSDTQWAKVVGN